MPEQVMAAVWADSANFQTKLCVQSVGPTGWSEADRQGKNGER